MLRHRAGGRVSAGRIAQLADNALKFLGKTFHRQFARIGKAVAAFNRSHVHFAEVHFRSRRAARPFFGEPPDQFAVAFRISPPCLRRLVKFHDVKRLVEVAFHAAGLIAGIGPRDAAVHLAGDLEQFLVNQFVAQHGHLQAVLRFDFAVGDELGDVGERFVAVAGGLVKRDHVADLNVGFVAKLFVGRERRRLLVARRHQFADIDAGVVIELRIAHIPGQSGIGFLAERCCEDREKTKQADSQNAAAPRTQFVRRSHWTPRR